MISEGVCTKMFPSTYPIGTKRKIGLLEATSQPLMGNQIQEMMTDTRVSAVPEKVYRVTK